MMNPGEYLLPGGYVDDSGLVHRDVALAPLSGREEELLAKTLKLGGGESASLVTAILSRCVHRIGRISPVSETMAGNLLVADRQYLLLKLREITFGDQIRATLTCAWPDCRRKMDIDFSINDIPIRESQHKGPLYQIELSPEAAFSGDNGEQYREIVFRLPNGNDQEVVSPLLFENEARALTALLKRCIQRIGSIENPAAELVEKLSPKARMEIEKGMEAVAPKIDQIMEVQCPECAREFSAPFELQKFFFGELQTSLDLLYREVHYLAYHYHWSEKEIMEMPRDKRRRYIEILAEAIERLNNEV